MLFEDQEYLFYYHCLCHCAHLVASKATKSIPNWVENGLHGIFNFISSTPKTIGEYKRFQQLKGFKPLKIFKPCQTRWLSLEGAISRILAERINLINYLKEKLLSKIAKHKNDEKIEAEYLTDFGQI